MPLSPAFTSGQNPNSPSVIVISDTSGGSDVLVTSRRVYLTDSVGNPVVPSGTTTAYVAWPIADSSVSIDCLTYDMALSIRVDWLNVSNVALYTLTQQFCFAAFNQQFAYSLCQGLVPPITLNTNYSANLAALWTSIKGSINAVVENNDIASSQNCLNQGTYLRNNKNLFY